MDKIEVTNGAVDPDHYGPIGDAARGIASYCDDPQRVHVYTAAFDAIKDILATRTDATPVAWMYTRKPDAWPAAPDVIVEVSKRWADDDEARPFWTETPLYTHPPATDVAALVEAAKETNAALERDGDPAFAHLILANKAALAPFTKGQNDE